MSAPGKRKPGTFGMYSRAMVDDPRMTDAACRLVMVIEKLQAGRPSVPISIPTLAERLRWSDGKVKRAAACARDCGFLRWKSGGLTRLGKLANVYEVLFPDAEPSVHQRTDGRGSHRSTGDHFIGPPVDRLRETHEETPSNSSLTGATRGGSEVGGGVPPGHEYEPRGETVAAFRKSRPDIDDAEFRDPPKTHRAGVNGGRVNDSARYRPSDGMIAAFRQERPDLSMTQIQARTDEWRERMKDKDPPRGLDKSWRRFLRKTPLPGADQR